MFCAKTHSTGLYAHQFALQRAHDCLPTHVGHSPSRLSNVRNCSPLETLFLERTKSLVWVGCGSFGSFETSFFKNKSCHDTFTVFPRTCSMKSSQHQLLQLLQLQRPAAPERKHFCDRRIMQYLMTCHKNLLPSMPIIYFPWSIASQCMPISSYLMLSLPFGMASCTLPVATNQRLFFDSTSAPRRRHPHFRGPPRPGVSVKTWQEAAKGLRSKSIRIGFLETIGNPLDSKYP